MEGIKDSEQATELIELCGLRVTSRSLAFVPSNGAEAAFKQAVRRWPSAQDPPHPTGTARQDESIERKTGRSSSVS
jgi:hypothetical protein